MKVKKIKIGIKSLHDTIREAGAAYEQVAKGKASPRRSAIYFSNLREMRRALTEKRLELLKTIKDKKPSSVYELAKMVDRDLKNVLQDVAYLRELGIVDVIETGDRKIPSVRYDKLSLEVAI